MRRYLIVAWLGFVLWGAGCPQPLDVHETQALEYAQTDEDDECGLDTIPYVYGCPGDMDGSLWTGPESRVGYFDGWGPGYQGFMDEDGDVWDVWIWPDTETFAIVPDLDHLGPVGLTMDGSCDQDVGPKSTSLHVWCGDDPDTLLFLSSKITVEDASGWTVTMETDYDCPAWDCHCWETCYYRRVTFEHGGESVSLLQGQSAQMGDYLVRAHMAYTGEGEVLCTDMSSTLAFEIMPASMDVTTVCPSLRVFPDITPQSGGGCACQLAETPTAAWSVAFLLAAAAGRIRKRRPGA